jgi:uncharacterized protein YqjF (DUF2071 family)
MKIPTIKGVIDRRVLINYTVDPEIIAKLIPKPFRPHMYKGKAIVGICLIRLKDIRPKGLPAFMGLSSENGAHRIAVEWNDDGEVKQGVYIPRRDTSSIINNMVGGRIFPGEHCLAKFDVEEANGNYAISFKSSDDTSIAIEAKKTEVFNPNSIFQSLQTVSDFFENGRVGYSPNGKSKFDGMWLKTDQWKVEALEVKSVTSSFFDNERNFPKGSVQFDNALLMTNVEHEWHSVKDKYAC